jgi:hypothetical protein
MRAKKKVINNYELLSYLKGIKKAQKYATDRACCFFELIVVIKFPKSSS